jgi:succinate dehydrogenase/fumarate reductase-like Fe-S protein
MKVRIQKSGGLASYDLPDFPAEVTIMEVLDYIYNNIDRSLAYYRHSACCQGICMRCSVKLDGRNVLACAETVPGNGDFLLEPRKGKVVRDLVVES